MRTNLLKKANGFTIIEVLIVLAIAGLILLMVFLAVPSLQRNSRNTQRKNDVTTLLGGISEYQSNNNGTFPSNWGGGQLTGTGTPAGAKLGYYTAVTIVVVPPGSPIQGGINSDTSVRVVTGAKCGTSGDTIAGAGRAVAVQYQIEGSGGLVNTCQEG